MQSRRPLSWHACFQVGGTQESVLVSIPHFPLTKEVEALAWKEPQESSQLIASQIDSLCVTSGFTKMQTSGQKEGP